MLNILRCSQTGPFDSPQGDSLGEKKHRLLPADRAFFRRHGPDDAVKAGTAQLRAAEAIAGAARRVHTGLLAGYLDRAVE